MAHDVLGPNGLAKRWTFVIDAEGVVRDLQDNITGGLVGLDELLVAWRVDAHEVGLVDRAERAAHESGEFVLSSQWGETDEP